MQGSRCTAGCWCETVLFHYLFDMASIVRGLIIIIMWELTWDRVIVEKVKWKGGVVGERERERGKNDGNFLSDWNDRRWWRGFGKMDVEGWKKRAHVYFLARVNIILVITTTTTTALHCPSWALIVCVCWQSCDGYCFMGKCLKINGL